MKHTHLGHCQACGRLQAAQGRNGTIAKHGYKMRFQLFTGTCTGSDRLPIELDHTYTDTVIDSCRLSAKSSDQYAGELTAGVVKPLQVSYGNKWEQSARRGKGAYVEQWVVWENADQYHREAQVRREIRESLDHAQHMRDHAKHLTELKATYRGQDLVPAEPKHEIRIGSIVRAYDALHTVASFELRKGNFGRRSSTWVITVAGKRIPRHVCRLHIEGEE